MIIQKVNIHGFGKLQNLLIEFHPRMNVIFGPNESGKSTLQQALLYFFFGFFQANRASRQENLRNERFKPWQKVNYGGQLWYQLNNGNDYQIDRNFDIENSSTKLFDSITGEQINDQFPSGRHGNVLFQKQHIGMEKELFEATSFVRQGEVSAISGSGDLMNDIIAILDSGSKDTSSKEAIERLQKKISEIGSDRSTSKPISKLKQKFKLVKEEYEKQIRVRDQLKEKILEKSKLEKFLDKQNNKKIELNYFILTRKIDDKERQFAQLSIYNKKIQRIKGEIEALSSLENFPEELRESIMRRRQNKINYEEQLKDKKQDILNFGEEVKKIEQQKEPVRQFDAIQSSLSYPEFNAFKQQWLERNNELVKAQSILDQEELSLLQAGIELHTLKDLQNLDPAELSKISELEEQKKQVESKIEQTKDRYDNLENQTWAKGWVRVVTITVFPIASLTALSIGMYTQFVVGFPIAAGLLVLGGIFYQIYRNSRKKIADRADQIKTEMSNYSGSLKSVQNELKTYLQHYGVQSLSGLVTRQVQNQKYIGLASNRNRSLESRDTIEFQLLKYLQLLDIKEIQPELLEKISLQYAQYYEIEQKLQSILMRIQQNQKDCESITGRMNDNQSALQELFLQVGLEVGELTAAEEEFDRQYQKKKQLNSLKKEEERCLSAIEGLLTTQSESEIQTELKELFDRRETLLNKFPKMTEKSSRLTLPVLNNEFEEVDIERQQQERQLSVIETEIKTILDQHRPLAEVEEDLVHFQSETRVMEETRDALELAKNILLEVSTEYHRTVIPGLNESVSHAIDIVSGGKYSQVHINPSDMSINLLLPETSTLGSSESLSYGTQEQLYLLLRLGLSRLMSTNGEPIPLILDDPFIHFDPDRLANMLQFLRDLSKDNQNLLFTKDPMIVDWFKKNSAESEYKLIQLTNV